MQVSSPTSPFTDNPGIASSTASNTGTARSFQSLLGELNDYLKETPAQRMEASILASLGITPEQLSAMSPADREKVLTKVKEIMKKEMAAQQ